MSKVILHMEVFLVGKLQENLCFYPRYNKNWKTVGTDGLRGGGYSVGYSTVHIIDFNKKKEQTGRTVYEYINKPDFVINYSWIDYPTPNGDPTIESKDENPSGLGGYKYSENGTLLKETRMILKGKRYEKKQETEYKYLGLGGGPYIIWGILKQPTLDLESPKPDCYSKETMDNVVDLIGIDAKHYTHGAIPWGYLYPALIPMQYFLNQKIDILYEDGEPIETNTTYYYNSKNQLIKEIVRTGNKEIKLVEYKYPSDITSSQIIDQLVEANRINELMESKQIINGKLSQIINEYGLFNNIPQLKYVKSNTAINNNIENRITYHKYDKYGNPVYLSKDDATYIINIWGYKGQYPIAEIKNITYEDLEKALTKIRLDRMLDALIPSDQDIQTLNALRGNINFQNAQLTTYTYKPLVGMTSMTDPSGRTTYYEYDGFNRLKRIYINEHGSERTIQSYDYHYRTK